MINTAMSLKEFFSSFDIPAYAENSVPDAVTLPYITYPLIEPSWNEQAMTHCQIWYQQKHLGELLAKTDQVLGAIQEGITLENDSGYVVLYPAEPNVQTLTDEDSQRAYINLIINAYHMPGN